MLYSMSFHYVDNDCYWITGWCFFFPVLKNTLKQWWLKLYSFGLLVEKVFDEVYKMILAQYWRSKFILWRSISFDNDYLSLTVYIWRFKNIYTLQFLMGLQAEVCTDCEDQCQKRITGLLVQFVDLDFWWTLCV